MSDPDPGARKQLLQIAVGTSLAQTSFSLDSEIRLAKAAVLYGDVVKIYSLGAGFALFFRQLRDLGDEDAQALSRLVLEVHQPDVGSTVKELYELADSHRGRSRLSIDERVLVAAVAKARQDEKRLRLKMTEDALSQSKFSELELAESAGLLHIDP